MFEIIEFIWYEDSQNVSSRSPPFMNINAQDPNKKISLAFLQKIHPSRCNQVSMMSMMDYP